MGFLDDAKAKAEELLGDNKDKLGSVGGEAIDKAKEAAKGATGGKFSDQIDQAADAAKSAVGDSGASQAGDSSGDDANN